MDIFKDKSKVSSGKVSVDIDEDGSGKFKIPLKSGELSIGYNPNK